MDTLIITDFIFLVLTDIFLIMLFVSSIIEKEKRATFFSFIGVIVNSSLWLSFILFRSTGTILTINLIFLILVVVFLFFSVLKFFPQKEKRDLSGIQRFDERGHMFSRNNLKFHPSLAKRYYSEHPENKKIDDMINENPEFGEPGHLFYDEFYSPVYSAINKYIDRSKNLSRGEVSSEKKKLDKREISRIIKEISLFLGAVDVGIAPLEPYHLYSHAGRNADNYGEVIKNNHKFAIVIVVAMNVSMIKSSPTLSVLLESMHKYLEAAKISCIVAEYIRDFGYDARAHTDGNYETLCVPLAVDSGLGDLGRIGIFMHPVYGPCVRLSVVTTDLELIPSDRNGCKSLILQIRPA